MDDSLRKDREYIDLTILRNINLTIPLNYLMWGVKFNDSIETYCFLITILNQIILILQVLMEIKSYLMMIMLVFPEKLKNIKI